MEEKLLKLAYERIRLLNENPIRNYGIYKAEREVNIIKAMIDYLRFYGEEDFKKFMKEVQK